MNQKLSMEYIRNIRMVYTNNPQIVQLCDDLIDARNEIEKLNSILILYKD